MKLVVFSHPLLESVELNSTDDGGGVVGTSEEESDSDTESLV